MGAAAVVVGVSLVIIMVITLVWLLRRRTPGARYRRTARDPSTDGRWRSKVIAGTIIGGWTQPTYRDDPGG
jgi:hypothetical protein